MASCAATAIAEVGTPGFDSEPCRRQQARVRIEALNRYQASDWGNWLITVAAGFRKREREVSVVAAGMAHCWSSIVAARPSL